MNHNLLISLNPFWVRLYGDQIGGRLEDMGSFSKWIGGSPTNIACGTARSVSGVAPRAGIQRLSRRRAAARFGVGISTMIAWARRSPETGSVAPGKMGGHRPRRLTGAWRDWLLERCRERDFTLRGLVAE